MRHHHLLRSKLSLLVLAVSSAFASCSIADSAETPTPLTAERRDLLKSRWKEFQSLPENERAKIEQLHQSLEKPGVDAERSRAQLDRYNRWLTTLTPAEKQRIMEASSAAERLARVEEILNQQSTRLEEDLSAQRRLVSPAEPPKPEPRRSVRQRLENIEDEMALVDELESQLTLAERRKLNNARGAQKIPILLALATKYDFPIPPFAQEGQMGILQFFMNLAADKQKAFGAQQASDLSPEGRRKLGQFILDLISLPEISQKKQFDFLQLQSPAFRAGIDKLTKVNRPASRLLVHSIYFQAHPNEAPESMRPSVMLVDPKKMIELVETDSVRPFGRKQPRGNPPPEPAHRAPSSGSDASKVDKRL